MTYNGWYTIKQNLNYLTIYLFITDGFLFFYLSISEKWNSNNFFRIWTRVPDSIPILSVTVKNTKTNGLHLEITKNKIHRKAR